MPVLLPLFPLNTPLVPGLVLPLHIFEPRYRDLVADLLARPDEDQREFGIVGIRDGGSIDRDGIGALFPVGTSALLREAERYDDGRFDIVTTGSRRFRVLDVDASRPLLVGAVEFLEDVVGTEDPRLARGVAHWFGRYRAALGGSAEIDPDDSAVEDDGSDDASDLPDDPAVLSYLVTAAMVLPGAERQELLAADTVAERLQRARRLLVREVGLISALGAVPALDGLAIPATTPSSN